MAFGISVIFGFAGAARRGGGKGRACRGVAL